MVGGGIDCVVAVSIIVGGFAILECWVVVIVLGIMLCVGERMLCECPCVCKCSFLCFLVFFEGEGIGLCVS